MATVRLDLITRLVGSKDNAVWRQSLTACHRDSDTFTNALGGQGQRSYQVHSSIHNSKAHILCTNSTVPVRTC